MEGGIYVIIKLCNIYLVHSEIVSGGGEWCTRPGWTSLPAVPEVSHYTLPPPPAACIH